MSHSPKPSESTSHASLPHTHPKVYPQFILLGDSITEGCPRTLAARLAEWYSRRLDVINRGFSGYTAPMGYENLQQFLPAESAPTHIIPKVQLMTLFYGANDSCIPGTAQHVPIATYVSFLKTIINYRALKSHDTKIILITPPPVDEWQLDGNDRNAEHTAKYARACLQVGQELNLPVLDLWTIFMQKAGWQHGSKEALAGSKAAPRNEMLADLLSDGLHFTNNGYDLMFDELVKVIREKLPDEVPEKLPMIFPDWKDKLGIKD